jgi:hypothetical protein
MNENSFGDVCGELRMLITVSKWLPPFLKVPRGFIHRPLLLSRCLWNGPCSEYEALKRHFGNRLSQAIIRDSSSLQRFVILPLRDGYPMSANKKHRWFASLRIDAAHASPTTTTPPASEILATSLYCGRRFHWRRRRRRDGGHVEDLEESIMLVSLSLSSA